MLAITLNLSKVLRFILRRNHHSCHILSLINLTKHGFLDLVSIWSNFQESLRLSILLSGLIFIMI